MHTNFRNNNIEFYNGLCGSGKTEKAIKKATKLVRYGHEKVAFVVPSIALQVSLLERIKTSNPDITVKIINNSTSSNESTSKELLNFLNSHPEPCILIITQALFMLNTYWQFAHEWNLIFDEEMDLIINLCLQFSDPKNIGTQDCAIKFLDTLMHIEVSEKYTTFQFKEDINRQNLELWANNDNIYEAFQTLISYGSRTNYTIRTTNDWWNTFKNKESKKLPLWAIFDTSRFSQFKSVLMMGADIENSHMLKLLESRDFLLQPSKHNTTNTMHQFPVNIIYGSGRDSWSISHGNKMYKDSGKTNSQIYMDLIHENIGDDTILVQNNKDKEWKKEMNIVQLPFNAEGLNDPKYISVHNYAESGAYNFTPEFIEILKIEGVENVEALQFRRQVNHIYQGFMRSSARTNEANSFNHKIFVPTKKIANELSLKFFENAVINQLSSKNSFYDDFLETVPAFTQVQMNARSRRKKTLLEMTSDTNSNNEIYIAFFKGVENKTSFYKAGFETFSHFASFLQQGKINYTSKNEAFLFVNAKTNSSNRRTNDCIDALNKVIILDIDNSNMSPEDTKKALTGINSVIVPSFNHMKENKNKFRIFIELNENPKDINHFREVTREVGELVRNSVYNIYRENLTCNNPSSLEQTSFIFEIDYSSEKASQLYYMPGIDTKYKEYDFFIENKGNAIDINKIEIPKMNSIQSSIMITDAKLLNPIMNRVKKCAPKHRNEHFTKIIGYIRYNRARFDASLLQQAYDLWSTIDPMHTKSGSFDKFSRLVG